MDLARIRNFSIIAHIDHGKSTLSDRILELTNAVDARDMRSQYLDSMDLERERGITIKAQNVRVDWKGNTLHLIDTPGHVDFGYEVSRSLAACEGVVLVVDAAQGIEAQTLANCYLALEHDLEIVAALNKIDLPAADPDRYAMEIETVLGIPAEDILRISAKTGEGIDALLDAVVERIPRAEGRPGRAAAGADLRQPVRPVPRRGQLGPGDERPPDGRLEAAVHAGRHAAGGRRDRRAPARCRRRSPSSGRARSATSSPASRTSATPAAARRSRRTRTRRPRALEGYRDPKPMVFCGLFPIDGDDFENLRESLERLKLNDASITYTPESSGALGLRLPLRVPRPAAHGDRQGAAGARVQPRPDRHRPVGRVPGAHHRGRDDPGRQPGRPARCRRASTSSRSRTSGFSIITPKDYTGTLMDLCQTRRGELSKLEYLSPERVELHYLIPLAEVVVDFFDQMKSRTQGYASLDYELSGYQRSNLVKVDLLLNGVPADAFATIVHRDKAFAYGNRMCEKLKELIPRQMFDVPIQAAIGGKVIARETVKAKRKDVLAKCYGGDITRKRKLLEKQKEGKKKMKSIGRVEVPGDVFISALKLD